MKKYIHEGTGEYWEIFSTDGLDGQSFAKHLCALLPKPGMKYRVYAFGGLCRGLYVGGRVIKKYRTPAQQREKNREQIKASMSHYRKSLKIK